MKFHLFTHVLMLLAVTSIITPGAAFAKDNIVVLEGREILLRDDGGWEYISKDRYTVTQDGRQVILKDNGKWEYVKKHDEVKLAPAYQSDKRIDSLEMQLDKAVVESILKKKNKRTSIKTQSVFYIDINLASNAETPFILNSTDKNNISVTDDKHNEYKILAIQPDISLEPGETGTIQIRIDGSPSILSKVTFMYVNFTPAINGISEKMTIKARWNDFIEKSVDEFDY